MNHALYKFPVLGHIRERMYIRLEGRNNVALYLNFIDVNVTWQFDCLQILPAYCLTDPARTMAIPCSRVHGARWPPLEFSPYWYKTINDWHWLLYSRRTVINSSLGVEIYTRHDVSLVMSESCQSHVRVFCQGIASNSHVHNAALWFKITLCCPVSFIIVKFSEYATIYCQLLYNAYR